VQNATLGRHRCAADQDFSQNIQACQRHYPKSDLRGKKRNERATGIEIAFNISQIRAISTEICGNQHVK
jgi:hypothetical protein